MNIQRVIKNFTLHALNNLPFDIFGKYMRKRFYVHELDGDLKNIIIKVAETRDELNQAMALIQTTYKDSNLTSDQNEKLRILKYNLLPTTVVYIAKLENEVIGTVSHILNSQLGLPIEGILKKNFHTAFSGRCFEISGLAIKKKWRSKNKGTFFALNFSAIKHSYSILEVETFYAITNFNGSLFNKNILMFDSIESKVKNCPHANNAEALAQVLNIKKMIKRFKRSYNSKSLNRNLNMLWNEFPYQKNCRFPKGSSLRLFSSSLIEEQFQFVLEHIEKFNILLTEKEKLYILNMYQTKNSNLKPHLSTALDASNRIDKRFLVNLQINYQTGNEFQHTRVNDISSSGFSVFTDQDEELPDILNGSLLVESDNAINFRAKMAWKNGTRAGYKISTIEQEKWDSVIMSVSQPTSNINTSAA